MNSNVDVLKELEVKNKEIYINKLGIDLDTNGESLLITINNIMSLMTIELQAKIKEICGNFDNEESIVSLTKMIHNHLIDLINKRNILLKEKILDIDNIDYKECLDNESKNIIESLKKVYFDNIKTYIDKWCVSLNDFSKKRVSDYLNTIYYEKLIKKIEESIYNMDNILYNNYQASYQRFLNLNEKTLK